MAVTLIRVGINRPAETNTLAEAWRKILKGKNISEADLATRIRAFVIRPGGATHEADTAAANLTKELASEHMSWNVYVKGLTMLGVDEITMLV